MVELPPSLEKLIDRISKNLETNESINPKYWAWLSETNISAEYLFEAFQRIICNVFEKSQAKALILKDIHREVKHSSLLLDAFLYAIYKSNPLGSGYDSFIQFMEKDLPFFDWSALKSPRVLKEPFVPNAQYNYLICTVLFLSSTIDEIVESDFVNISNAEFLMKLTKKARSKFALAIALKSVKTNTPIPNFMFSQIELLQSLIIVENKKLLHKATEITYENNKYFSKTLDAGWDQLKDNLKSKVFSVMVLPFVKYYTSDILEHMINHGLKFDSKSFNFDLFINTPECMNVVNPRLIIEICQNKTDDTTYISSAADVIGKIPETEFLDVIFKSNDSSIMHTAKIFVMRLQIAPVNIDTLSLAIHHYINENAKVILILIKEALKEDVPNFMTSSLFEDVTNQISEYPELALEILGRASVTQDCTNFWVESDTLAILLDQVICMREKGTMIQEFFVNFAQEVKKETILAVLPMISQVPLVYSKFEFICRNRFSQDNEVIDLLNNIIVL